MKNAGLERTRNVLDRAKTSMKRDDEEVLIILKKPDLPVVHSEAALSEKSLP